MDKLAQAIRKIGSWLRPAERWTKEQVAMCEEWLAIPASWLVTMAGDKDFPADDRLVFEALVALGEG